MICARCGADLPPGAMFCGECGSAVYPAAAAAARVAVPSGATAPGATAAAPVVPTADDLVATSAPASDDAPAPDVEDDAAAQQVPVSRPETDAVTGVEEDRRSTRVVDMLEKSGADDPSVVSGSRAWPSVIAPDSAGSALHDFSGTPASPVPEGISSPIDEATRMPDRPAPAAVRFSLHFSTGESVTVEGNGLIGRRPVAQPGEYFDAYITISDPGRSVSKTHLEYGQEGGVFWVSDRFSANGTVVREPDRSPRLCPAGMRSRVARGSRVDIGEQFFVVS